MKINRILMLAVATLISMTAACASKPTLGDKISSHGKAYQAIGKQWNQGNDLVKDGRELVRKGKQQIEDGEENIEDGEAMIEKGQRLVQNSEATFAGVDPKSSD